MLDLGIAVRTAWRAAAIHAAHARAGNGEYDPLVVVKRADLPAFVHEAGTLMNHQAPVFLRRSGAWPAD